MLTGKNAFSEELKKINNMKGLAQYTNCTKVIFMKKMYAAEASIAAIDY
jgi:hypothetical protein